ncbi:MAG: radical SAM protein, partial [Anaerococcus obesiensis]
MTDDVAKKSIDFLLENSGSHYNLDIDFFGGEPLLNWDLVKNTVDYARSKEKEFNKHFNFTLTTNGMLLDDEKIEYLNKNMKNVVLSLDGRKEK